MKDITFTYDQVTKISLISILFKEEPSTYMNGLVSWYLKDKGEVTVRFDEKQIYFTDFTGSTLEYFSVKGIMEGFESGDYYTEKD
jgi:hypothetical protein